MPRNDDLALQLFELRVRIEALRAALQGRMPFTSEERADLARTLGELRAQTEALEEEIRRMTPDRGAAQ